MHYYHKMKHNKEWIKKERARKREVARKWRKNNKKKKEKYGREYYKSRSWYWNAFHSKLTKIMPKWADRNRIEEIYKEAYEKGLEVDHIIPRNGKLVTGLHVENNLQVLTKEENAAKHRKFCTKGLP